MIIFATGNSVKFSLAKNIFNTSGLSLVQKDLNLPEIQSMDVAEIARFSAEYAVKMLDQPVMVTDVGMYISALNGFPGPLVKYVNATLQAEDILAMMQNKTNRRAYAEECLAYAVPGEKTQTFKMRIEARIATSTEAIGPTGEMERQGTMIDRLMIFQGLSYPQGAYSTDEIQCYFSKHVTIYQQLVSYLEKEKNGTT